MDDLIEIRPGVWVNTTDKNAKFFYKEWDTGKIIKARRKQLRMTQGELGAKVGVTKSTISRYESGEIDRVPSDFLPKIAEALQCSPLYLIAQIDTLYPEEIEDTFDADLLNAYKNADEKTKRIVRQLLDL